MISWLLLGYILIGILTGYICIRWGEGTLQEYPAVWSFFWPATLLAFLSITLFDVLPREILSWRRPK